MPHGTPGSLSSYLIWRRRFITLLLCILSSSLWLGRFIRSGWHHHLVLGVCSPPNVTVMVRAGSLLCVGLGRRAIQGYWIHWDWSLKKHPGLLLAMSLVHLDSTGRLVLWLAVGPIVGADRSSIPWSYGQTRAAVGMKQWGVSDASEKASRFWNWIGWAL
jgi:hypothetical protein